MQLKLQKHDTALIVGLFFIILGSLWWLVDYIMSKFLLTSMLQGLMTGLGWGIIITWTLLQEQYKQQARKKKEETHA